MSDGNRAAIGTLAKANRYLFELTASMPFDAAVERVHGKADQAVGRELETLKRCVAGDAAARPAAELALLADLLKGARDKARVGAGVVSLKRSLAEARVVADEIRGGWLADVAYLALLLVVAALIATIWLVYVAPEFEVLFLAFGATLPAYSNAIAGNAWVVLVVLVVLAAALAWLVAAARRLATAVETLGAVPAGSALWLAGGRIAQALQRWRAAALASAWFVAGRDPVDAVRHALTQANANEGDALATEVALAAELGLAAHELDHQRRVALAECRTSLELRRAFALRGMQIAIAVVVGAIVIAIYLPIFQMGAVI